MKLCFIRLVIFAPILFLSSCAPVRPPVVKAFADGKDWVLMRPLDYDIPAAHQKGTIPQGFVTDFASIPHSLWSALPPYARYGPASVVHDYLYWTQPCSREEADIALREAMRESGVSPVTRETIYRAVRAGGGSAWSADARERAQGLQRIIPAERIEDIPPELTWPEYRKTLAKP